MGDSPFHFFFLFLVLFFFAIFCVFSVRYLCNYSTWLFVFCPLFTLPLNSQKEAEAGSAEVQPARNTFGI